MPLRAKIWYDRCAHLCTYSPYGNRFDLQKAEPSTHRTDGRETNKSRKQSPGSQNPLDIHQVWRFTARGPKHEANRHVDRAGIHLVMQRIAPSQTSWVQLSWGVRQQRVRI